MLNQGDHYLGLYLITIYIAKLFYLAVSPQIKPTSIIGETITQNWNDTGLFKPSAIKPVITTIEKNWCSKRWGD